MMTFKKRFIFPLLFLLPLSAHASFIESTIGTAIVNDATATYFNPAALMLMKNPQIITQGSVGYLHTQFNGQTQSALNGLTESGSSSTMTRYYTPSLYMAMPVTDHVDLGLAVVTNNAYRGTDEDSILRYAQSNNNTQDYDVVPAIAIKMNEFFSLGAGVNFSYANFNLQPITGFPGSNIADSQSNNQSDGTSVGGNGGFLLKPNSTTVIGFNYRGMMSYHLSGRSVFNGTPQVISNHYHFDLTTPARSILSISHVVTEKLGFIGTIQRIQWSSLSSVNVYGIANVSGTTPIIVDGNVPFHLRDTWFFTLGTHYRITPKWIVRVAGSYNQTPSNPHYQIANGDSIVLGATMGYQVNSLLTVDGGYAHAFMQDQSIYINGNRFMIQGVNKGSRDAVSLKLTFNV